MKETMNKLANLLMKPLLRSPLHFLASRKVVLLAFQGRKSGRTYVTPVQYAREGDVVTVFTHQKRTWWRNFQGDGAPMRLWLQGSERRAFARIVRAEAAVVQAYLRRVYTGMNDAQAADFAPQMVMIQISLS